MTADTGKDLVALLSCVVGGSLEARIDGAPFAALDGEARELTLELGRLGPELGRRRSGLSARLVELWEFRGLPSALARSGWRVNIRDGGRELVRMGRTVSALTGHVHVSRAAWGKWRDLP